jgi:murein DD-endopeptidase MepM/ murein hydrolase activator NlpD
MERMWQRAGKAQVRDFKQALTVLGHHRRHMFERPTGTEASARVALTRARLSGAPGPGRSEPFSLVVDLAAEPVGSRWARGAATLALLCGAALALAPGMSPFSTASARTVPAGQQFQMNAMLNPGEEDGQSDSSADIDTLPMAAAEPVVASDSTAVRVQGAVTDGLYWSLRSAGVSPQIAADYLQALSTRIDVGADVAPYDRFDLVISKTPTAGAQPLLYAALRRADAPDVELMKWRAGGRTDWFDTDASGRERANGLMAPVAGRITSSFGVRLHPILRFARFHAGIDFGADSGSPIVAAADGMVVGAGWAGGYGRQVRVAHGGGIATTYSHMSGIAAGPGTPVRQGQVIGYVGSSGISTGPHLHFEVRVNGRAVDPTQVRFQSRSVISGAERQAFNARLKRLMAIGEKKA